MIRNGPVFHAPARSSLTEQSFSTIFFPSGVITGFSASPGGVPTLVQPVGGVVDLRREEHVVVESAGRSRLARSSTAYSGACWRPAHTASGAVRPAPQLGGRLDARGAVVGDPPAPRQPWSGPPAAAHRSLPPVRDRIGKQVLAVEGVEDGAKLIPGGGTDARECTGQIGVTVCHRVVVLSVGTVAQPLEHIQLAPLIGR